MGIRIAVPRETAGGERRVALSPEVAGKLVAAGHTVVVEQHAGVASGWPDAAFEEAGASIAADAAAALAGADVVLRVSPPSVAEVALIDDGATLLSMLAPLTPPPADGDVLEALASRRVTAYSMELMPRISRAQSMDVLSSQSTVAGYRAVLVAAGQLDKFFPLLMTAAGTIAPARVLVLGAGVAGLQAIATARRLGAVVSAFDLRAATREQVESLGAKFVSIDTTDGEAEGGYARELTPEEQEQQRQLLADVVAKSDVVITTALVPGRPAPRLILTGTIERMRPGAVIVDLAGESGGNCEVGSYGEIVHHAGVVIVQPRNLAADIPLHASQLYARNLANFLPVLLDGEGNLAPDPEEELVAGTCVTRGGAIVHPMVLERRGQAAATTTGGAA